MGQIRRQLPASGRGGNPVVGSVYPGLYEWLRDRLSTTYVHGERADYLDRDGNACQRRSTTMAAFDNGEPVTVQAFYASRFRPRLRPPLGRPFDPSSFIRVSADDTVAWDVEP